MEPNSENQPLKKPDSRISLIDQALSQRSPSLAGLVQGLVTESLLPDKARRDQASLDRLDEIQKFRLLRGTPALNVARFKDDILALVHTSPRLKAFLHDLATYEAKWSRPFPDLATSHKTGDRHQDLFVAMSNHFATTKAFERIGFPTAALVDAWNRSSFGSYVSDTPAVTGLFEGKFPDFVTLCHLPEWRTLMGAHATRIGNQLCAQGERLDLVVFGDGSGELGASIAESVLATRPIRIIHIDISPGMLHRQQLRYRAHGISEKDIVSIQGNLMQCSTLLKSHVPDLGKSYFVLHEILDDLRTHAVWSDRQGTGEMGTLLTARNTQVTTMGLGSEDPIIKNLPFHLPFYRNPSSYPIIRSFCPEAVILLREMLNSIDKGAIYVGDYGMDFIGDSPSRTPQALPYRIYGPGIGNESRNYIGGFSRPCSITADVHPAILHFAEAFGGKIKFLGSQEEFVKAEDPEFHSKISDHLSSCKRIFEGQEVVSLRDQIHARSILSIVCPTMFAGIITKGI